MQMATKPLSMAQWIRDTIHKEGIFSFYRGLTPPLCTIPLINAIVMSSYEFGKRVIGLNDIYAGMFAGFVNSFIISPVELIKWRLQLQTDSKKQAYYKGPIDWALKVIKQEGLNVLMTSGLITTILRETACYAGQFGGYHYSKKLLVWILYSKFEG